MPTRVSTTQPLSLPVPARMASLATIPSQRMQMKAWTILPKFLPMAEPSILSLAMILSHLFSMRALMTPPPSLPVPARTAFLATTPSQQTRMRALTIPPKFLPVPAQTASLATTPSQQMRMRVLMTPPPSPAARAQTASLATTPSQRMQMKAWTILPKFLPMAEPSILSLAMILSHLFSMRALMTPPPSLPVPARTAFLATTLSQQTRMRALMTPPPSLPVLARTAFLATTPSQQTRMRALTIPQKFSLSLPAPAQMASSATILLPS